MDKIVFVRIGHSNGGMCRSIPGRAREAAIRPRLRMRISKALMNTSRLQMG
jgi:hypothetical protein